MRAKRGNNVWQATYQCENGSTMSQKKVLKLSVNLNSIEKRYRDLV